MNLDAIHCGDWREWLATLPDASVHCCVTSPPYWGLRDYCIAGQIGLEKTPEEYVAKLVAGFREVRRVLRGDGTLWLNLGDSYSVGTNATRSFRRDRATCVPVGREMPTGLKPKDLVGIPWRVAFALQADGWWLRQDIIWSKPNPMPESVRDRCTKAHEYIFLLTKSARYYYDAEAVKESFAESTYADKRLNQLGYTTGRPERGYPGSASHGSGLLNAQGQSRNKRSVWTVATQPYKEAHFATFPPKLIEPCILAGTSERGCCPACGAPWARIVRRDGHDYDGSRYGERVLVASGGAKTGGTKCSTLGSSHGKLTGKQTTLGWRATCECNAGEPAPCIVMDPFMGAGTTPLVAWRNLRRYVACDLNPEYVAMAERRIEAEKAERPLFAESSA